MSDSRKYYESWRHLNLTPGLLVAITFLFLERTHDKYDKEPNIINALIFNNLWLLDDNYFVWYLLSVQILALTGNHAKIQTLWREFRTLPTEYILLMFFFYLNMGLCSACLYGWVWVCKITPPLYWGK